MGYEMYKQMVETGEEDIWDRFDDLLHGYFGHPADDLRLIDAIIARMRHKGHVINPHAQDDLDLFVSGYQVKRITRFLERENLNKPTSFMPNLILMLTLAYPGDIPLKMIPSRPPTRIYLSGESEVEAFLLGDRHETPMVN